ncbi:MAG: hypothetical protein ACJ73S_32860 [Mycobacteriales bacterium]
MDLDVTAPTARLAAAAADLTRLLPGRLLDTVLAGAVLTADGDGLLLAGTDRDLDVRLRVPAVPHTDGRVLVPARLLADTLRTLDAPEVRLVVEGSRLAVRTPAARFALPLLDGATHPGVPEPPPVAGSTPAGPLAATLGAVAGAASRDDALPIFTGVRLHASGDRLSLLATDRYRLAAATLPWDPAEGVDRGDSTSLDALAPAAVLAEVARQASGAATAALHADADRLAVCWDGASVATGQLAAPFPDDRLRALLTVTAACAVEVESDALAAAIRRAALYGGPRGTVTLRSGDAEVTVSGQAGLGGESEEAVKAAVSGDRLVRSYQAPLLADALRAFAGRRVRITFQDGERATALTAADPEPAAGDLHYLVVPLRIANPG